MLTIPPYQVWINKANQDNQPFFRFTLLYIGLVQFIRHQHQYQKDYDNDWDVIATYIEHREQAFANLPPQDSLKVALQSLKHYLEETKPLTNKHEETVRLDSLRDYFYALKIIRNNLFHADEEFTHSRDDRLVELGADILEIVFSHKLFQKETE